MGVLLQRIGPELVHLVGLAVGIEVSWCGMPEADGPEGHLLGPGEGGDLGVDVVARDEASFPFT
eukprot:4214413-Heterocapsa_arctica.AAC.1